VARKLLLCLAVALTAAVGGAGCAHVDVVAAINRQPALSNRVPRIRIDEPASMMALKYLVESDVNKLDVVAGLDQYWNGASVLVNGSPIPARFIVESKSTQGRGMNAMVSNELIILFTGGVLFLFGVPTAWDTQMVTFTLEFGGHEYKATAQGKCYAGLYYPGDPGPCAFSRALAEAVRLVARQVADAWADELGAADVQIVSENGESGDADAGVR